MAGVGDIEVSPEALRVHATLCEGLATDLNASTAPGCPAHPHQATTAAVAAVHVLADIARAAMATRMRSTATAVHTAADGFTDQETTAVAALRSVPE